MKKFAAILLLFLPALAVAGTANKIPKFVSGTVLGNSSVSDDGTTVSSTETWSLSGGFEVRSATTSASFGNTNAGFHAGDSIIPNDPTSGYGNSTFGYKTGTSITTGRLNTFIGNTAGVFTDVGITNTAVGAQALFENISGNANVALGFDALVFQDAGDNNTAVGDHALGNSGDTVAHNNNTGIGQAAGQGILVANDAIEQCTFLGSGADTSANSLTNAMALGYNARVATSNTVVVGNTSVVSTILRGVVSVSSMSATGTVTAGGVFISTAGITLGTSGTTITRHLSATASLDFGATAAGACDLLTINVTNAADGDTVSLGVPAALAASDNYQSFNAYVSSAGVVTVKRCNLLNAVTALSNPAAATVRVDVWQH